jgi:hypothetical protein
MRFLVWTNKHGLRHGNPETKRGKISKVPVFLQIFPPIFPEGPGTNSASRENNQIAKLALWDSGA